MSHAAKIFKEICIFYLKKKNTVVYIFIKKNHFYLYSCLLKCIINDILTYKLIAMADINNRLQLHVLHPSTRSITDITWGCMSDYYYSGNWHKLTACQHWIVISYQLNTSTRPLDCVIWMIMWSLDSTGVNTALCVHLVNRGTRVFSSCLVNWVKRRLRGSKLGIAFKIAKGL